MNTIEFLAVGVLSSVIIAGVITASLEFRPHRQPEPCRAQVVEYVRDGPHSLTPVLSVREGRMVGAVCVVAEIGE